VKYKWKFWGKEIIVKFEKEFDSDPLKAWFFLNYDGKTWSRADKSTAAAIEYAKASGLLKPICTTEVRL
jgi:hypothetical protein